VRRVEDADQPVGAAGEKVLGLQGTVREGVNRAFEGTSVFEGAKGQKAKSMV